MGGYLAAYHEESGEQLWTLKVYDNRRDPQREGDVQDVFFRSMTMRDDGKLLIENERGPRFVVDPASRSVEASHQEFAASAMSTPAMMNVTSWTARTTLLLRLPKTLSARGHASS
jgi:hypothetical protein